jgi:hypothetical protein
MKGSLMARQHEHHALAICTGENVERALRNAGVDALDHETLAWRIAVIHPMPEKINRLHDDDEVYRGVSSLLEERADGPLKRFVRSKTSRGRIKFGLPVNAYQKSATVIPFRRSG